MILLAVALLPLIGLLLVKAAARPFNALIVYAAVLPLGSSLRLPLGLPPPFDTVSTVLGALTGLLLVLRLIIEPRARAHPIPAVTWIWVMFFAANAATFLWSINRAKTFDQLLVLGPLIGLFIVASAYRSTTREIQGLETAIVVGGAAAGAVALLMLVTGTLPESGTGVNRFYASGGDPNITAASMLLPFSVALSWAVERTGRRQTAGLVFAALIALGIVLTVSRGGVLSLLVVIAAWIVFSGRMQFLWITAAIAALSFVVVPDAVTQRLGQTGDTGRVEIWEIGVKACPEYCVLGAGMGTFPDVHEDYRLNDLTTSGLQLRFESHNIILGAAVELGILGLTLLVVALAMTMLDTKRASRVQRHAALAGLAGILAANMLISTIEFKYFWLALTYATLVSNSGSAHSGMLRGGHSSATASHAPTESVP